MSDCCKDVVKGASKSNDNTLEVIEQLQTRTADNNVSVCANCGKGEEESHKLKSCTACKTVKYCNRVCQIAHRLQHKKECKKRAAELHDIELFKQPPPQYGDCPICFLRMPSMNSGSKYMSCCGKTICSGCCHAPVYDNQGNEVDNEICPFCRAQTPTTEEEYDERRMKRVDSDDPIAIYNLGNYYRDGTNGYQQDYTKALELWHRSGELGYALSYSNIGYAYENGEGVNTDMKKAMHYYELAAMGGNETARYNVAVTEQNAGNVERALKHYMIAVRDGDNDSLDAIKELYSDGHATKDAYMRALQSYQTYLAEIKSKQRDEAAAFDNEEYRYY